MRSESFQQFAIVYGDTAQSLTEQLNAKLYELRDKSPKVTFEGLIARISYSETVKIIEDVSDEYEMVGIQLTCQDCPCFEPQRNRDGSENRRAKRGGCPYATYKMTFRDSRACNKLFQMINSGEVTLCLAESED